MRMTPREPNRMPTLDQESFQKLLEAAFVLQQHNERQSGGVLQPDFNVALAAIVDTHKLIQSGQLDFRTASSLVADLARKTTNASGVAIGLVESDKLAYQAASGNANVDAGTFVPLASCVSADCFIQCKLLLCPDTSTIASPGSQARMVRGIKALLAAPIYLKGKIAGVLELRFARPNSFETWDVGTAQLIAGLVSEAMLYARDQSSLPATLETSADNQEDVLDLEDVLSELPASRLEEKVASPRVHSAKTPAQQAVPYPLPRAGATPESVEEISITPPLSCLNCGHTLDQSEAFCGQCGTPRPVPGFSVQSKWASLWQMHQESMKSEAHDSAPGSQHSEESAASNSGPVSLHEALRHLAPRETDDEFEGMTEVAGEAHDLPAREPVPAPREHPESEPAQTPAFEKPSFSPASSAVFSPSSELTLLPAQDTQSEPRPLADPVDDSFQTPASPIRIVPDETVPATNSLSPWASARRARAWLESSKGQKHSPPALADFWKRYRANVYVGIAAVILSVSVIMFVVSLGHAPAPPPSTATSPHRRKSPPPPNLTLFERFLVGIGLAEPPDAPIYMGNPNTQVWVDVHTALYYCPGAELYGKTQGGKLTTQRDAQQDQFEPANRKVCD